MEAFEYQTKGFGYYAVIKILGWDEKTHVESSILGTESGYSVQYRLGWGEKQVGIPLLLLWSSQRQLVPKTKWVQQG